MAEGVDACAQAHRLDVSRDVDVIEFIGPAVQGELRRLLNRLVNDSLLLNAKSLQEPADEQPHCIVMLNDGNYRLRTSRMCRSPQVIDDDYSQRIT
jgi:hypothetical protein